MYSSNQKQKTLRPSDVIVACQLTQVTSPSLKTVSELTILSVGECHNAVARLASAGLLSVPKRHVAPELLLRFILYGVPYSFPAQIGPSTMGIATAFSVEAFKSLVESTEAYVWPDGGGATEGLALTPLFPSAVRLRHANPALYEILALVDVLRVGDLREKQLAETLLRERLAQRAS